VQETKKTALATKKTALATKKTALATKKTALATKTTALAMKKTALATKKTALATKKPSANNYHYVNRRLPVQKTQASRGDFICFASVSPTLAPYECIPFLRHSETSSLTCPDLKPLILMLQKL
jgi:hypothetical protein